MMALAEEQTNIKSVNPEQLANLIEYSKTHKSLSNWDKTLDGVNIGQCSSEDTAKFLEKYYIHDIDNAFVGGNYETIPIKGRKVYGTNISNAFKGLGLKEVDEFSAPYATDASGLFENCENLTTISNLNLPKVQDISRMFKGTKIETIPESIANIQPIKADEAFANTNIDGSQVIDFSKATSMIGAYKGCQNLPTKFPYTINLSSIYDLSKIASMFEETPVREIDVLIPSSSNILFSINLGSFSSLMDLVNIFNEDGNLQITLKNLLMTLSKDNYEMEDLYPNTYGTMKLVNFKNGESGFDLNNLTTTQNMFANCKALTTIPKLKNTSNVTTMQGMFYYCNALTTIPQLDTSNVTTMEGMFIDCISLTTIPKLDTSKVWNMQNMFIDCISLTTIPQLDTSNVTAMCHMFERCKALTTIPQLDTSNVINMTYMFDNCISLTTIPQLDTSKVINMTYMFRGCNALTTINGVIDFSSASSRGANCIANMFNGCNNLAYVRIKNASDEILNYLQTTYPDITFTVVT